MAFRSKVDESDPEVEEVGAPEDGVAGGGKDAAGAVVGTEVGTGAGCWDEAGLLFQFAFPNAFMSMVVPPLVAAVLLVVANATWPLLLNG